ncbi:MAG: MFS transporter, partial [Noviherbaspirillum sp.]
MIATTTREQAALAAFWLKLYPPGAPESWHVPPAGSAPGEAAAATTVGQAAVHFDTFAFAIASVLVFPALFFPFAAQADGMLYALLVFALAFAARPAGTLVFLALRRRFGRPACLVGAFVLLGACAAGIGLLPGYAWLGAPAIALLVLLRLVQGAAMAGAADGPAALLAPGAPAPRGGCDGRARRAALAQLGAPLGLLAAAGLFYLLAINLTAGEFLDWGWRYPFLVAPALHLVALFARLRCLPEGGEARAAAPAPARVRETLRLQGRNLFIAVLAALASHALLHLATVFPLAWAGLDPARQAAGFLPVLAAGAALAALGVLASAWLAGRSGRRPPLLLLASLAALASGALPMLMEAGSL